MVAFVGTSYTLVVSSLFARVLGLIACLGELGTDGIALRPCFGGERSGRGPVTGAEGRRLVALSSYVLGWLKRVKFAAVREQ